jgi:hypothetical protein
MQATIKLRQYKKFLLPASVCIFVLLLGCPKTYGMMSWEEYSHHSSCPS